MATQAESLERMQRAEDHRNRVRARLDQMSADGSLYDLPFDAFSAEVVALLAADAELAEAVRSALEGFAPPVSSEH